jgi:hypothetical protein
LPGIHKSRVYRPQGWISAVVLVDGRVEGVWEYEVKASRIVVKVDMFAPSTTRIQPGIEAEAQQLGKFLGGEATLAHVHD